MMMIRYLMILTLLLGVGQLLAQSASLAGKVIDEGLNEPVVFTNVVLLKGEEQVAGTSTDFDGNYNFSNIPAGTYNVLVTYVGQPNLIVKDILLIAGKVTTRDFKFPKNQRTDEWFGCIFWDEKPILETDMIGGGRTYSAEEIGTTPFR